LEVGNVATENTQKWCPTCQRKVLAVRSKPNRWAHGAATFLTGGLWAPVWVAREAARDLKNTISPGWRCTHCGSTSLRSESSGPSGQKSVSSVQAQPEQQQASGPTRFRVVGVDRESKYDTELVVVAQSAANAKVKAELEGVIVTDVVPVVERPLITSEQLAVVQRLLRDPNPLLAVGAFRSAAGCDFPSALEAVQALRCGEILEVKRNLS
jgi:hypothetical protein